MLARPVASLPDAAAAARWQQLQAALHADAGGGMFAPQPQRMTATQQPSLAYPTPLPPPWPQAVHGPVAALPGRPLSGALQAQALAAAQAGRLRGGGGSGSTELPLHFSFPSFGLPDDGAQQQWPPM